MDHPLTLNSTEEGQSDLPTQPLSAQSSNNPGSSNPNNEAITNYLRYGTIRPPISVLQDEFLYQYRLWKEYSEPLYGIDNNFNYYLCNNTNDRSGSNALSQNSGEGGGEDDDDNSSSSDSNKQQYYEKCMASIRTMYAKHSRQLSTKTSGGTGDNNSSSFLFESRYAEEKVAVSEEEEEEEEEKLSIVSSSDEPNINNDLQLSRSSSNCHGDNNNNNNNIEKEQLEQLCALLFRPGSKFVGTIDIILPCNSNNNNGKKRTKTKSSYYELIIMEHDALDERGIESRGVLARHAYAGDEQCVFVKLSLIPIVGKSSALQVVAVEGEEMKEEVEEEKESIEEEVVRSSSQDEKDDDRAGRENKDGSTADKSEVKSQLEKKKEKLTIQMEYVDGDNMIQGTWDHDTLSFHGTATKLSQGGGGGQSGEQNEIGGTIVSGLISGHGSYFNEEQNNSGSSSGGGRERNRSRRSSSSPSTVQTRSFSLSPCSHLHTRGISPAPTPKDALSEAVSRLILSAQAETSRGLAWKDLILSQDPTDTSTATAKHPPMTPDKKQTLLDEIASHDNYKLIHHRARTESLRREALIKLSELGSLVDFAELARKRNVAKRREKWRKRVRKYTPGVPSRHRLLQRRKDKSKKATMATTSDVQKKKVQFYDHLASISWSELLEESSIQAERTCAIFRRQTALLNSLTFDSDEYKAQLMADIRRNGLTIAASHAQWDQCIQMGRTVALGWSWFERGSWSCFERSAVVGNRCVYLLFQMHSRLENNHSKLEKAFRGADERLTNVQLDRIKNGSCGNNKTNEEEGKRDSEGSDGDESAGLCGVCQSEMHEEGEGEDETNPDVCLPCSHRFHWKCLREWLHDHSQCPICRLHLSEV